MEMQHALQSSKHKWIKWKNMFAPSENELNKINRSVTTSYVPIRLNVLIISTIALALSACAPTLSNVNPDGAKRIAQAAFKPITWSRKDTKPTVAQIKIHNEVGVKLGLWKYPPRRRGK